MYKRLILYLYFAVTFTTAFAKIGNSFNSKGVGKSASDNGKMQLPILADESIMRPKAHGTTDKPVMQNLRWNCDYKTADKISSFNRHYAEYSGYFKTTTFLSEVDKTGETTYYDSVSGKPLFIAPRGRTFEEFRKESEAHGWPSFRDEEVVWENVRTLADGEAVSTEGTHLGHNLPDRKGNRYCINLVSVTGQPAEEKQPVNAVSGSSDKNSDL